MRDFDDGELRFQASKILDGNAVGEAVIDRMIGTATRMLDVFSREKLLQRCRLVVLLVSQE